MGGGITVAMALVDCVPVVLFMAAAVILQRDLYDQLPKGAYPLVAAGSIMAFLGGFMKALWKILYATGVCDYVLLDHALFTLQGPGFLLFFLGLTGLFWKGEKNAASTRFTNYDIDYQGNLNLIEAARAAGVRHFGYVSVINADKGEGIPMVHSKYLLEEALKASGLTYVIWRPTGYFYDIAHVFWPMIKSKSVQLLRTKGGFEPRANVVDTRDFARFILETMCDENKTYSVGGTETYTYRQIAEMFYNADGVTNGPVKTVPAFMMDVLAHLPKIKAQGKSDVLKFSKFTLLNDCVGDTEIPGRSFREYIAEKSYAPVIEAELAAKEA